MHESLNEFKFRPDTTTNSRVICPCVSEKLLYNVVNTLAPSFLIGSSSYLQVTRTSITSRMSSKVGQIRPRTAELAAIGHLKEFKFRLDTTTNSRVICPCASEKLLFNVVKNIAASFLIGSSSFLQVTRTTIKSWKS